MNGVRGNICFVIHILVFSGVPEMFLPRHQLLQRDPLCRLGCIETTEPIRRHPFFSDIDWGKLEAGQIEPPYKPTVV